MNHAALFTFALTFVSTTAVAQTSTSSAASEVSAVSEAPAPPPAISPWRTEFVLLSTFRYQYDNGDRTQVLIDDPNNPGQQIPNQNYDPTGEDFYDAYTTVGGEVSYGPLQVATRFDTALFFHTPIAADNAVRGIKQNLDQRYDNVYNLNYISASYTDRDVDLTLGDFYITLGRGLILAIRKVGDVGVDNKLRGANGKVRLGDLTLNAFGGFSNIKRYEAGTGYNFDNGHDLIVGGRAEYGFGKYLRVGGHGVLMRNDKDLLKDVEVRGYGATVELPRPTKWLSVFGEVAALERDILEPDQAPAQEKSFAAYASANVFAGPLTVLIEGKHYDAMPLIVPDLFQQSAGGRSDIDARQAINQYIALPTAERPTLILLTNQTVTGGRVRVDYRVNSNVVPFLAGGRYHDETAGKDSATDATAVYGGGDFRWEGGHAAVDVGYRGQFGGLDREDIHVFVDTTQHLWDANEFELYVNALKATQANEDWVEGRIAGSFKAGRSWSATLAYEFYTRTPALYREHYISVAGQWQFSDRGLIRGLVGGERAGLKCSGGVCRFFPGFEGGRVELDWRF